jgi:hypothetical protein
VSAEFVFHMATLLNLLALVSILDLFVIWKKVLCNKTLVVAYSKKCKQSNAPTF